MPCDLDPSKKLLSCVNWFMSCAVVVIRSFADRTTADLYHGKNSKPARRVPKELWTIAQRKLDLLNRATSLTDLRVPPSNRLEKLRGDLEGFHSIRVNEQDRVVFRCERGDAHEVAVVDDH